MSLKLRPLGNNLIVEPIEVEQVTASGIILPETAKEKPQQGIVVAAGPGRRLESSDRLPMTVKANDRILHARYGGTIFKIDGQEVLVISEDDVLAVVA